MKLHQFLLCFFLLFSSLRGIAQNTAVSKDSLSVLADSASINNLRNRDKLAIDYSAQLIALASVSNEDYYIFVGHEILGDVYTRIKDTLYARLSFEKGLKVAQRLKVDSLISRSYIRLGNNESDQKENYQKGIDYYKKSIEINERTNNQENNLSPYVNIGWTYLDEGQEDRAFPFLLKSRNLLEKLDIKDQSLESAIQILLGRYYLSKGNFALAEEQFDMAASIVDANDYLVGGSEVYKYRAQLAETQRNFEKAYRYQQKFQSYDSRIYEASKLEEIQAASAKFNLEQMERNLEAAKNEQDITEQLVKKNRQLNTFFIISSLVLLTTLLVIFGAFKSRKKYIKRLRIRNSELVNAKDEAEKLSKLKTQFFSTVSHELRTPLYGVIGIASILLEDNTIETHQDDLKSLKFSADYLLALINDVLLINKMDANGVKLEHTPFRLSVLTQSITRSFEFSLEQNKNTIHLNIDQNVPNRLVGDSVRLSQVLMNLIGNAIKFNENGNIWVNIDLVEKTTTEKYRTKFTIKDDGIGIPKSKQKTIFEEFSQVENRNYNYQGTGLGLPIVKKLLALYGSEIKLESAIGEGSTFSFIIDLEANDLDVLELNTEPVNTEEAPIHSLKSAHILVVDDNRINQKITQKMLEKRQFKCSLADDGEEAVAMAKEHTYDLILMDIHMPKIDGIEATQIIRTFNTDIPIVALTAVEMDEMRVSIMESGMNDIILKPYDVSQFLTTILRNLNAAKAKNAGS